MKLKAIHEIVYDLQGVRKVAKPGEVFECSDEVEAQELLWLGAVKSVDSIEIDVVDVIDEKPKAKGKEKK